MSSRNAETAESIVAKLTAAADEQFRMDDKTVRRELAKHPR